MLQQVYFTYYKKMYYLLISYNDYIGNIEKLLLRKDSCFSREGIHLSYQPVIFMNSHGDVLDAMALHFWTISA